MCFPTASTSFPDLTTIKCLPSAGYRPEVRAIAQSREQAKLNGFHSTYVSYQPPPPQNPAPAAVCPSSFSPCIHLTPPQFYAPPPPNNQPMYAQNSYAPSTNTSYYDTTPQYGYDENKFNQYPSQNSQTRDSYFTPSAQPVPTPPSVCLFYSSVLTCSHLTFLRFRHLLQSSMHAVNQSTMSRGVPIVLRIPPPLHLP